MQHHQFKENGRRVSDEQFLATKKDMEEIVRQYRPSPEELISWNGLRKVINVYSRKVSDEVSPALDEAITNYSKNTEVPWEYHLR